MSNPAWDGDWQSDSIWLTKELADARVKLAALKAKHERLTNLITNLNVELISLKMDHEKLRVAMQEIADGKWSSNVEQFAQNALAESEEE